MFILRMYPARDQYLGMWVGVGDKDYLFGKNLSFSTLKHCYPCHCILLQLREFLLKSMNGSDIKGTQVEKELYLRK